MSERQHDFTGGDDEYVAHVLYILEGDPNCAAVVARVNQMGIDAQVMIQDAARSRPNWLRGVPSLLTNATETTPSRVTERTADIIARLAEIRQSEWQHTGVSNMNVGSGVGGESLYAQGMFSIEGDPAPGPAAPDSRGRPRNEKSQRRAQMEERTNSAVEALQNSRAQLDQRIQMNMPGQHRMMPQQRQPAQPPSHMQRRAAW